MNDTTTLALASIQARTRNLQHIAAMYGDGLSEEFRAMSRVAQEASRIARESRAGAAPVPLLTDAAKVAAVVKKTATDRLAQREAASVATEVAERAEREAMRLALEETPRVVSLVVKAFDAAAAELDELVPTAPVQITATSTTDDFAAHTRMLALVDDLNRALQARVTLVPALGEDLRGGALLWLVLDPRKDTSVSAIRQALADYAEDLPSTVEDWQRIAALGASLAGPGQATDRAARFGAATHAAGFASPDGGRLDRTYGDALGYLQASS